MKGRDKAIDNTTRELTELRQKVFELESVKVRSERTVQDLRKLLSMQQVILDSIPDIVWLKDVESRFLAVNEAFAKASKRTKEDLIGKTDFDFWPASLAQRYRDDDVQVMKSGVKKVIEETLAHSENEKVWIETIKSPVHDDMGHAIGTVGISRDITERKLAQERIQAELAVAARIQKNMLPQDFPHLAPTDAFDLYALMSPAREVGGDFYDFFLVDNDHLCVSVGDVAGKGVAAALFMAITIALLRSTARETSAPDAILNRLNRELVRGNDACMFVTAFCAILDLRTGSLSYANAGHQPPLICTREKSIACLAAPSGPPLGLVDGTSYREESLTLDPGNILFAYTDGVTEACDKQSAFFSEDRLVQRVLELKAGTCEKIISGVMESVASFCTETDQTDDITMLALAFKGRHAAERG
ncbi:MAG: SpoIIE family protein phosphatase [Desulfomonile tiedjei]|nr:SpoIIE family protein phosphatase [Desulfomonile tiedjei]